MTLIVGKETMTIGETDFNTATLLRLTTINSREMMAAITTIAIALQQTQHHHSTKATIILTITTTTVEGVSINLGETLLLPVVLNIAAIEELTMLRIETTEVGPPPTALMIGARISQETSSSTRIGGTTMKEGRPWGIRVEIGIT